MKVPSEIWWDGYSMVVDMEKHHFDDAGHVKPGIIMMLLVATAEKQGSGFSSVECQLSCSSDEKEIAGVGVGCRIHGMVSKTTLEGDILKTEVKLKANGIRVIVAGTFQWRVSLPYKHQLW